MANWNFLMKNIELNDQFSNDFFDGKYSLNPLFIYRKNKVWIQKYNLFEFRNLQPKIYDIIPKIYYVKFLVKLTNPNLMDLQILSQYRILNHLIDKFNLKLYFFYPQSRYFINEYYYHRNTISHYSAGFILISLWFFIVYLDYCLLDYSDNFLFDYLDNSMFDYSCNYCYIHFWLQCQVWYFRYY